MHETHLNKKFNLEQSINAIIQRLRISKQNNKNFAFLGTLWQTLQYTSFKYHH